MLEKTLRKPLNRQTPSGVWVAAFEAGWKLGIHIRIAGHVLDAAAEGFGLSFTCEYLFDRDWGRWQELIEAAL